MTNRVGDLMFSIPRPVTRDDCRNEARPCPWVACRHHLLLEVTSDNGGTRDRATSLRLNQESSTGGRRAGLPASAAESIVRMWIDQALELLMRMPFTCALDVVEAHPGGLPAAGVASLLGVSKQAIEQDECGPRAFLEDELRPYLEGE